MRPVATLSPVTRAAPGGRDIFDFDRVRLLCSVFLRFVVRHDCAHRSDVITTQSPLPKHLDADLELAIKDPGTDLIVADGRLRGWLDTSAAAVSAIGRLRGAQTARRRLPEFVRGPLCSAIARSRYRLFGRTESRMPPSAALRARVRDVVIS